MKLAAIVWNKLSIDDRIRLLRHCKTITYESTKNYEATLKWNRLMPVTQRDLLDVDFSFVLGRDIQPI